MNRIMILLLLLFCHILCVVNGNGMFTSVHRMEGALRETLPGIIRDMETYVTEEMRHLQDLRW